MSALAPPLSRVPVGPAAQRYVIEPTLLGQGRFGKCYLARQALEPRQEFAVKRVPLQASNDQPASVRKRAIENEVRRRRPKGSWWPSHVDQRPPRGPPPLPLQVSILSCLQHCPEVVRLVEVCHAPDGASVDIVMEHCRGGTLEQWQQGRPLREVEVAAVLQQVLRALAAAHASGIAFGDLKPANILLRQVPAPSEAPQIALADFGCSQRVSAGSRASRSPGTPVFAAPEVFRHLNGMEADLWSCGVLVSLARVGGLLLFGPGSACLAWLVFGPSCLHVPALHCPAALTTLL